MRTLVTGGAGFLGSHLVDALLDLGHEVTVFDNFSRGRWVNLTTAWGGTPAIPPPGVSMDNFSSASPYRPLRVQPGSLTWQANVSDVMRDARPHVVFHLAAQTDVSMSVEHPVADFGVNVTGTLYMLQAAKAAGVRRFVFASSAAVFGSVEVPTTLSVPPGTMAVAPISPYGAAKAAAMLYVDLYGRQGDMITDTVVFSNVYGPRQAPGRGAVNIFARALLAGEPVTLHGDGGNVRDYLYVDGAVRALIWAGGLEPPHHGKYRADPTGRTLVGTGVGTTDDALLSAVTAEVARQVPGLTHRPAVRTAARPGDIRASMFPRSDFAATSLDEGLKATVAAIRQELGS